MSRYIYQNSFMAPAGERIYADGRDRCDRALKKLFARGPQQPDSLQKRAPKAPTSVRANGTAALADIKKIHSRGRHPGLPEHEAQGDEEFRSRSVSAVKKAQADAVHVDGHRMLAARELNKAFAESIGNFEVDLVRITRDRGLATGFRAMTTLEKRAYRKALTNPALNDVGTRPPQSSNAQWDNARADDGAITNWPTDPVPSQRPTIVGGQPIGTPSDSNRDAALDAIKRALAKPKHALTADMDDDEDEDEDLDQDQDGQ